MARSSVCAHPLRAAVYPLQFHWAGDARPAAASKIGCEDFDDGDDFLAVPLEGAASSRFKNGSRQLKKEKKDNMQDSHLLHIFRTA